MPAVEVHDLKQQVVIYRAAGTNRDGLATVSAPEELTVRFRAGLNDSFGTDENTVSVNASMVLPEAVPIGSIVWEGRLCDLPATPTPLYVVVNFSDVPDIKNRHRRKTAQLSFFSDTLPEIIV